jgi:hypothetical protein
LLAEGVTDPGAWRRFGRRRHQLFGITRSTAGQFDAISRGKS